MGFCPNCGSWVEEGDACNFCGGSGTGNSAGNGYGEASSGGYRRPAKEYVPVEKIRSFIRNNRFFDNEIWGSANSRVLDALNGYDGDFYDTINALNDLITRELRFHKFYMMKLDCYKRICVEFVKEDKYVGVVTGRPFDGTGFDIMDDYEYYLDDRIRDIPEFSELVREMESDGFEYRGISLYASYNPERVYLKFVKDEYQFKSYWFDIEKRTWKISSEYSQPCKLLYTSKNPPEKRLLMDEIKRIEEVNKCHRDGCSSDIFRFKNEYIELYFRYNDKMHMLLLEDYCILKDREDLDGKYGFLCPY